MIEFKEIKYLRDIKSPFIIKEVLSFIDIKHRLNMVKYNKKLQKISEIDLKDYKKLNGKYIKDGKNGIVREYNFYTHKLIFKGWYLNGKRNGKGKEYYKDGQLIFEGWYLNGKRNGKGKEYTNYGKLMFEGEYLNGEKNGKGKEFYYNNHLKFEGEYLNGKIWNGKGYDIIGNIKFEIKDGKGNVKEYSFLDYFEFEGEYINGEKNGKGKEYFHDKIIF